jgi:AcrR family transcriptional regulator
MDDVQRSKEVPCKRPYELGLRLELSGQKREAILNSARAQLESGGLLHLTMDGLAQKTGVTRQTVHNLFGTKAGLLEALFDQLALDGGMEKMREVMQQPSPDLMLAGFVDVFIGFWRKNRLLFRRIHGIAAIDPEFGAALQARNKRRHMAATRIVGLFGSPDGKRRERETEMRAAELCALTSFEFFDALVESCGNESDAAKSVLDLAKLAVGGSSR